IPVFAALLVPSLPANSPTTCPKPRLPSTIAIASLSNAMVGARLARTQPSRIQSRYLLTRSTPCESCPTRFDSTSLRAIVAASGSSHPALRMIAVTSSTSRGAGTLCTSVDLRLGGWRGAFEESEIAALIRLRDVTLIERAVTTLVTWLGLLPRGAAALELRFRNLELQFSSLDVELDQVAVLHERKRSSDEGFGRNVQHARAVARAAHACVGNANHVTHALREELLWNRELPPLRHPGRAQRTRVLEHQHGVGGHRKRRIVDARGHVVVIGEHHRRPRVLEQMRLSSRRLDHRTVGRQIATQHGQTAARHKRTLARKNDVSVEYFRGLNVLAERPAIDRPRIEHEQIGDVAQQRAQAPGVVKIFHQELARGTNIGHQWRLARQGIEAIERQRNARTPRDRD